jgi:hypothetical protein
VKGDAILVDRAVTLLRHAVAAGYKDAAYMKKDPGLDALRGRDDFEKLLNDLHSTQGGMTHMVGRCIVARRSMHCTATQAPAGVCNDTMTPARPRG